MVFSSLTFLFIFLPILLLCYFLCRNLKAKNIILLIFSLLFYSWGEPVYIVLMLFTTLTTYIYTYFLNKTENQKTKKTLLILSLVTIFLILGFYKYGDFFIDNINNLFKTNIDSLNLPLPIGISFYSFQVASYIIDLYRKKVKFQKNFLTLALYVSFFPQLVAGPIVRYETIEKELENRKSTIDNVIDGTKRFIIGLSKKIIIANQMAIIADSVFNYANPNELGTLIIWLGTLAYTLQIYFDFSGYSDMAIGLGKIFGFNFPENFNYPYIAKSITDFWRRWHISLSSWFKDYVYIPLGGSRAGKIKLVRNILIVWTLTGIWHGAAWNFVIWGLYFGLLLLIEKLFLNKILNKLPTIINWLYTIILVMISWVIFRSNNIENICIYFQKMFIYESSNLKLFLLNFPDVTSAIIYIIPAVIISFPIIKHLKNKFNNYLIFNILSNIILIVLLLFCISMLVSSSYNPFIYFRF